MLTFSFFFKQKTAYDVRISDWSSDVCSSDLPDRTREISRKQDRHGTGMTARRAPMQRPVAGVRSSPACPRRPLTLRSEGRIDDPYSAVCRVARGPVPACLRRSEEHTSELQSLMRISYAVFCLKKQHKTQQTTSY